MPTIDSTPSRLEILAGRALMSLPRPVQRLLAGRPVRVGDVQLDVEIQLLLKVDELVGRTEQKASVPEARADLKRSALSVAGEPRPLREIRWLSAGGVPARLYVPEGGDPPAPLLVYYHGGGHVAGDLDSHDTVCRFLADEARVRVLSVDYRLAPENPFPAAVEDALTALRYAVAHAGELGADPGRVGVGGDSAGGNLAAVVSQLGVDGGGPVPAFQLLIYPVCDLVDERPSRELFAEGYLLTREDIAWYTGHYLPNPEDASDPRVSPLLREDLSGLPPAHVVTAGFDPLRDEGEEYARRMRDAGVPVTLRRYPATVHGFVNMLGINERFRTPVREIAAALRWGLAGRA